jgi:hypothetical protein
VLASSGFAERASPFHSHPAAVVQAASAPRESSQLTLLGGVRRLALLVIVQSRCGAVAEAVRYGAVAEAVLCGEEVGGGRR